MNSEGKKRQPRIPLTPEEVADLILIKKIKEHHRLQAFKGTRRYKILNLFNVVSFFIYCELVCCIIGPCHYQTHFSRNIVTEYGEHLPGNKRVIEGLKLIGVNGNQYELSVHEYIPAPTRYSAFDIGKDFLLQKEIKGVVETSEKSYLTQLAFPLFFLSVFVGIFSFIFFFFDLNQNPYSLWALSSINAITVFGFLMM